MLCSFSAGIPLVLFVCFQCQSPQLVYKNKKGSSSVCAKSGDRVGATALGVSLVVTTWCVVFSVEGRAVGPEMP